MGKSLGKKICCPSCNSGFYDLNKDPAVCPKCANVFKVTSTKKKKASIVAPTEKVVSIDEEDKKKLQNIDDSGDIDLSEFNDVDANEKDDNHIAANSVTNIEDISELEDDIASISELENIEVEEDKINSDDAGDDIAITEMDNAEKILIDKIETA